MKNNNVLINENQEEIIRKDNRKARKSFLIVILVSAIVGAIFGFFSIMAGAAIPRISESFRDFMINNAGMISIIFAVAVLILTAVEVIGCIRSIGYSKKAATRLIENDEEIKLESIEKRLSFHLWITNAMVILHFLCFSVIVFLFMNFMVTGKSIGFLLFAVLILVVGIIAMTMLQQKLIDCIRLLNPEKKGSVYDMNFHKRWEESSDEAELFTIYKAAYKSYRAVNMLCMILWVCFMLLGLTTGIGFLSVLTVLIIWAVSTAVYSYHSMKAAMK